MATTAKYQVGDVVKVSYSSRGADAETFNARILEVDTSAHGEPEAYAEAAYRLALDEGDIWVDESDIEGLGDATD